MATFEIIIQRKKEDGWPVIAMETRAGEFLPVRSESQLKIVLTDLLGSGTSKDYGQMLGNALFLGTLKDGFIRAVDHARTSGDPLRILLTVEAPELKPVHWERLCAPYDGSLTMDFISLHQLTPFSIYLPSLTERRFPAIGRRDLRALVLVAGVNDVTWDNPKYKEGLADFDVEKTAQDVRAALGNVPCDVLASYPGAAGAPTLKNLCDRITNERYTLLHIVCHGQYSPQSGETRLILPGDDSRPVTAKVLIEQLARLESPHGLPHFTFLMACKSAAPEAEQGLGGLAQRLVRDLGMPAVLAMTEPISIDTANELARTFYKRLAETGEPDRALTEGMAGLMGQQDATVPAIFSRLGGRPLFSDALTRDLTPDEIVDGLKRLADLVPDRAPTLIDLVTDLIDWLKGMADPTGRSEADLKQRKKALDEINDLSEQILDMSFPALALGRPVSDYKPVCPFPGLTSFKPQDKDFFFGREPLVDKLMTRLTAHNFLAVLGASGSGKSSVVLAGLVPALGGQHIYLSPGGEPLERLKNALAQPNLPATSLLVIDQFEEVFTLCRDEKNRTDFFKALLAQKEVRKVVITMRADFLGECAPYPELRDEIQKHTELVAPMDAVELRRAIEQQAAAAGLRFEADLAEDILEDVRSEPGAMPLMQHALLLLWQRRRGKWLLLNQYRDFGMVKGAITHTAGEIYTNLKTAAEKEQMRWIFLRLTRLDDNAAATQGGEPAERRDTRRRVTLDEIVPAGGSRADIQGLVKVLADARLVITGTNPVTQKDEVEVAHEALIRYWPLLRTWLDENREALRVAETVRAAAQDWVNEKRDENLLNHRGKRLAEALQLEKEGRYRFNQLELDYLNACQALAEKALLAAERRRRILVIAAAVIAVIMTGLAIWGGYSASEATTQANNASTKEAIANTAGAQAAFAAGTATIAEGEAKVQAATASAAQAQAEAESQVSLARALSAESSDLLANRPDLTQIAALLAIQAYRYDPEVETSQALSNALDLLPQPVTTIPIPAPPYMDFSPDGALLATSTEDGPVMIWNTTMGEDKGKQVSQFKVDGKVSRLQFLPDNQRVLTLLDDNVVEVWYPPTGQSLSRIPFDDTVEDLMIDPITGYVIAGADNGEVAVWDPLNGDGISQKQLQGQVLQVGLAPYQPWAAAATSTGQVYVWDYETGADVANSTIPTSDGKDRLYAGISFLKDSVQVLVKVANNQLNTWDATKNAEVLQIPLGADLVTVATGQNGLLAMGDIEGWVRIMNSDTGLQMKQMRHSDISLEKVGPDGDFSGIMDVSQLDFSSDDNYLISFAGDSSVRLWSTTTGDEISRVFNYYDQPVAINTDARMVAVSNFQEKNIHVYHMVTGKEQVRSKDSMINEPPVLSPDGQWAVGSTYMKTVTAVQVANGHEMGSIEFPATVIASAISPDSERAASLDQEGNVKVWQMNNGKVLTEMEGAGAVADSDFTVSEDTFSLVAPALITFSQDGSRVVTGTPNGVFVAWDAGSGAELGRKEFPASADHYTIALSPDGRTIAAQSNTDKSALVLWDLLANKAVKEIQGVNHYTMAFTPDGSSLVTGGTDEMIQAWDSATGNQRFQLEQGGTITHLLISPDGKTAAVGGANDERHLFLRFVDLEKGQSLSDFNLPGIFYSVAMSPDWQYVLVPESSNQQSDPPTKTIKVYDRQGNFVSDQHAEIIYPAMINFSKDGKQIIFTGYDYEITAQSWKTEDLIGLTCQRLERNLTQEEWKFYIGDKVPYTPICPGLP